MVSLPSIRYWRVLGSVVWGYSPIPYFFVCSQQAFFFAQVDLFLDPDHSSSSRAASSGYN